MGSETVVSLLATTLLATGWAIWLLPVGTCKQCEHCQMEKVARERERGRYHVPGERHRR